jgi:hypothetical protein
MRGRLRTAETLFIVGESTAPKRITDLYIASPRKTPDKRGRKRPRIKSTTLLTQTAEIAVKQAKSRQELERLLIERLNEHAECRGVRASVIEVAEVAPHGPNWRPMFISAGRREAPAVAWRIAREMGAEFELAADSVGRLYAEQIKDA